MNEKLAAGNFFHEGRVCSHRVGDPFPVKPRTITVVIKV